MKDKLIVDYINRMTTKDIDEFAKQNGVSLKSDELDLVYKTIKTKWRTILYGNPIPILEDIKGKIEPNNYKKIENLYTQFKNKLSNYL